MARSPFADMVILTLAAISIYVSLQREGDLGLTATWFQEIDPIGNSYKNGHAPSDAELVPLPLITDIDGDGLNEVVVVTREPMLKILKYIPSSGVQSSYVQVGVENTRRKDAQKESSKSTKGSKWKTKAADADKRRASSRKGSGTNPPARMNKMYVHKEVSLLRSVTVTTGSHIIGIGSGYLRRYSRTRPRQQMIVVVTESFRILCFDYKLRLRWERTINTDMKDKYISEVAVTINPHPVRRGDRGVVVVGARLSSITDFERFGLHQERKRKRGEGSASKQDSGIVFIKPEHEDFAWYAFDGKTGKLRWRHAVDPAVKQRAADMSSRPGDEVLVPDHKIHKGEVDWNLFRHDILKSLPHRWNNRHDTIFEIAHFQKKRSGLGRDKMSKIRRQKTEKAHRWTDDMKVVGGGKKGTFGASSTYTSRVGEIAKRRLLPFAESERVRNPNVLVAHLKDGIEVVHLFTGMQLSHLTIPSNALHVDVNGDGVVDHVEAVGYNPSDTPANSLYSFGLPSKAVGEQGACHGTVTSGIPPIAQLFSSPICGKQLGKHILLDPEAGSNASLGRPFRVAKPAVMKLPFKVGSRPLYDTLFFVNTGTVTCIGPEGKWKWSSDTSASWLTAEDASEALADKTRKSAMRPSLLPFSLKALDDDHKFMIAVIGEQKLSVLDGNGHVHASSNLLDYSITSAVVGDINNDGMNDLIVTTASGYYGFVIEKRMGAKLFTVLMGMLIACLIVALIVKYVQQVKNPKALRLNQVGDGSGMSSHEKFKTMMAPPLSSSSLRSTLLKSFGNKSKD